ncbi:MAG: 4-hydroxy-tetrahydrodipicolinate reductase [Solirubrobacterales bacterium]
MIRILLCGCNGKMGKVICNAVLNFPNLVIEAGVDRAADSDKFPVYSSPEKCETEVDVILDFSRPDALDSLLAFAKEKNLPVIFCTTGYSEEQLAKIKEASMELPVFRSANMSIGINVVNNVLRSISAFLYNNYDIEIIEKHHNQKVDAPSGTALLLADTIKASIPCETVYNFGREGIAKREHKEIGIHAIRGGNIVGDHEVIFAGAGEVIEIKHSAISREVFAVGALKACEYMFGKGSGLYNMDDVIKNA